jgi:predicted transcriptional regulator
MDLVDTVRSVLKQKGQDIWSVPPEAWVYDAVEMMADKHVGALLVISEGRLRGSGAYRRRLHENHDKQPHPPSSGS